MNITSFEFLAHASAKGGVSKIYVPTLRLRHRHHRRHQREMGPDHGRLLCLTLGPLLGVTDVLITHGKHWKTMADFKSCQSLGVSMETRQCPLKFALSKFECCMLELCPCKKQSWPTGCHWRSEFTSVHKTGGRQSLLDLLITVQH